MNCASLHMRKSPASLARSTRTNKSERYCIAAEPGHEMVAITTTASIGIAASVHGSQTLGFPGNPQI
jgi:hypothetical protein